MKKGLLKLVSVFMFIMAMTLVTACSKSVDNSAKNVNNDAVNETVDENAAGSDADAVVSPETDADSGSSDNSNESKEPEVTEAAKQEEVKVGKLPLVEGGVKGVFEKFGMIAGVCINPNVIPKYSDHVIQNYTSVTMENEMKPDAIISKSKSVEANDIVVAFPQNALNMLEWAKTNGIGVRGHTIIWHSQTPQWIFYEGFDTSKPLVDRDTMLKRMESYIKQVFEQLDTLGYFDIIYAYDVVNEAIEDNGSLRNSLWKQTIGDDYLWYAFYYADKYAPESCKLFYNDYNEQFKTNAIIKMAQSLVTEDGRSLIDGIGCQGHLYTKDSIDAYITMLEAFNSLGLDVAITELDVSLGTWPNKLLPTKENLQEQGRWYYEFINRIAEGNAAGTTCVSGITLWGLSDGNSWRSDRSPLLFDRMFLPKNAYFGALQVREYAGFDE